MLLFSFALSHWSLSKHLYGSSFIEIKLRPAFYEELKSLWKSGVNKSRKFIQSASQSRMRVKLTYSLKWLNGKIFFQHPSYMANRRRVESVFIIYYFFYYFQYISFFAHQLSEYWRIVRIILIVHYSLLTKMNLKFSFFTRKRVYSFPQVLSLWSNLFFLKQKQLSYRNSHLPNTLFAREIIKY